MFDFRPVLDALVAACQASFSLPVLYVVVTQQGNWLGFVGRRFLAPGVLRDLLLSTEDYPGHAVQRYLREEALDVAMTVRIATLSNPADEE